MKDRPRIQDFDWPLLAIVGAIPLIGVLEIYSSTHASAMNGMQWKQMMWIAAGIGGMFLISRIDYHTLLDQAPALYLFGIASLLGGSGDGLFALRRQALDRDWRASPIYKCQS